MTGPTTPLSPTHDLKNLAIYGGYGDDAAVTASGVTSTGGGAAAAEANNQDQFHFSISDLDLWDPDHESDDDGEKNKNKTVDKQHQQQGSSSSHIEDILKIASAPDKTTAVLPSVQSQLANLLRRAGGTGGIGGASGSGYDQTETDQSWPTEDDSAASEEDSLTLSPSPSRSASPTGTLDTYTDNPKPNPNPNPNEKNHHNNTKQDQPNNNDGDDDGDDTITTTTFEDLVRSGELGVDVPIPVEDMFKHTRDKLTANPMSASASSKVTTNAFTKSTYPTTSTTGATTTLTSGSNKKLSSSPKKKTNNTNQLLEEDDSAGLFTVTSPTLSTHSKSRRRSQRTTAKRSSSFNTSLNKLQSAVSPAAAFGVTMKATTTTLSAQGLAARMVKPPLLDDDDDNNNNDENDGGMRYLSPQRGIHHHHKDYHHYQSPIKTEQGPPPPPPPLLGSPSTPSGTPRQRKSMVVKNLDNSFHSLSKRSHCSLPTRSSSYSFKKELNPATSAAATNRNHQDNKEEEEKHQRNSSSFIPQPPVRTDSRPTDYEDDSEAIASLSSSIKRKGILIRDQTSTIPEKEDKTPSGSRDNATTNPHHHPDPRYNNHINTNGMMDPRMMMYPRFMDPMTMMMMNNNNNHNHPVPPPGFMDPRMTNMAADRNNMMMHSNHSMPMPAMPMMYNHHQMQPPTGKSDQESSVTQSFAQSSVSSRFDPVHTTMAAPTTGVTAENTGPTVATPSKMDQHQRYINHTMDSRMNHQPHSSNVLDKDKDEENKKKMDKNQNNNMGMGPPPPSMMGMMDPRMMMMMMMGGPPLQQQQPPGWFAPQYTQQPPPMQSNYGNMFYPPPYGMYPPPNHPSAAAGASGGGGGQYPYPYPPSPYYYSSPQYEQQQLLAAYANNNAWQNSAMYGGAPYPPPYPPPQQQQQQPPFVPMDPRYGMNPRIDHHPWYTHQDPNYHHQQQTYNDVPQMIIKKKKKKKSKGIFGRKKKDQQGDAMDRVEEQPANYLFRPMGWGLPALGKTDANVVNQGAVRSGDSDPMVHFLEQLPEVNEDTVALNNSLSPAQFHSLNASSSSKIEPLAESVDNFASFNAHSNPNSTSTSDFGGAAMMNKSAPSLLGSGDAGGAMWNGPDNHFHHHNMQPTSTAVPQSQPHIMHDAYSSSPYQIAPPYYAPHLAPSSPSPGGNRGRRQSFHAPSVAGFPADASELFGRRHSIGTTSATDHGVGVPRSIQVGNAPYGQTQQQKQQRHHQKQPKERDSGERFSSVSRFIFRNRTSSHQPPDQASRPKLFQPTSPKSPSPPSKKRNWFGVRPKKLVSK